MSFCVIIFLYGSSFKIFMSFNTCFNTFMLALFGCQEDPLEKEMATNSSILIWRIPCIEEPSRLQSMRFQRVIHDWVTNTFTLFGCNVN